MDAKHASPAISERLADGKDGIRGKICQQTVASGNAPVLVLFVLLWERYWPRSTQQWVTISGKRELKQVTGADEEVSRGRRLWGLRRSSAPLRWEISGPKPTPETKPQPKKQPGKE